VTRKAYGGAYIAMNSRALGATRVFAWPGAEVAVMGAVAAVRILHRRTLASVPPEKLHETEALLAEEHEATAGGLQRAVDLGVIDAIIEPARTRQELARAIAEAPQLRGSHANIPLLGMPRGTQAWSAGPAPPRRVSAAASGHERGCA
jgi:acetyl-CoA/propionyl-CoA carboxylase carboxyl transferase subunit